MSNEADRGPRIPKRIEVIARGVLQRGGRVLLCRDRGGGYCYLPGGHVEPGEAASEAVARELGEEAGLREISVGSCALVTEQRFQQNGQPRHEVNFVFHVERCLLPDRTPLPLGSASGRDDEPPIVASLEDHIEFVWVEAAALGEVDLRPASMKAWLMSGSSGLDHPAWLSHTG
ncbi:MAG: NUDIX hydrolase [Phycisphaerales bacterium]